MAGKVTVGRLCGAAVIVKATKKGYFAREEFKQLQVSNCKAPIQFKSGAYTSWLKATPTFN